MIKAIRRDLFPLLLLLQRQQPSNKNNNRKYGISEKVCSHSTNRLDERRRTLWVNSDTYLKTMPKLGEHPNDNDRSSNDDGYDNNANKKTKRIMMMMITTETTTTIIVIK